jgi:hypothetical protein
MDPDRAATSPNVDMVGEREISKTEVARDLAERSGELVLAADFPNFSYKGIYTTEHSPVLASPRDCVPRHMAPVAPFS